MKKMIISDYDKTLYTSSRKMPENVKSIEKFQSQGNLFVIATGRAYTHFKSQLTKYQIPFDYLILNHGTVILGKDEQILKTYSFQGTTAQQILESVAGRKDIEKTVLFDAYRKNAPLDSDCLTKLTLWVNDPLVGEELVSNINQNFSDVKSYMIKTKQKIYIEVISINTDKGKAIEEILKREKIDQEDIYTIGDGPNDVEMIQKYHGYGMKKSEQCVLDITTKRYDSVADLITDVLTEEMINSKKESLSNDK